MEWRGACDVGKGRKPIRPRHLPVGQNTWRMQNPVNPLPQKYSTLPKFGIAAFSRHPGPRRGAIVRRNERGSGCGGRGCVGHAKAGPGRDEPREGLDCVRDGRRLCPAKPLGGAGSLRTAKTRGPDRRCYGQALRRWIGALPGFEASPIREVTEARRNSAPGRARISRQTIAQGRPGVFPAHLFPACAFACANSWRSGSWVPAGTRPSLRPLHGRERKRRAKLGRFMPRECRFMRELRIVLPDGIDRDAGCVSLKIHMRS